MSIAAQLAAHEAQIRDLDSNISQFLTSITPQSILSDPAFQDDQVDTNPYRSLSIYQLNQKQKELDEELNVLNELWLVKALFTEIEVSFDPFVTGSYVCDLDELHGIVSSLEKAEAKVGALETANLVINGSLRAQLADIKATFIEKLDHLYGLFFPAVNTVNAYVTVNENVQILLSDFIEFCNTSAAQYADSYINDKIRASKRLWESEFLIPLISGKIALNFESDGPKNTLIAVQTSTSDQLRSFLSSLLSFVAFINVIDLHPLKQFFSTMVSNSLVEVISKNIEAFMNDKEELSAELLRCVEQFTKTGWPMPLRNVFVSTDKIHDSLQALYLNWLGDKYINEIRSIFSEPNFLALLAETKSVEETREITAPAPAIIPEGNSIILDPVSVPAAGPIQDTLEEGGDDWNEAWGSDLEDDVQKIGKQSNSGNEDWDDNWDQDQSDDKEDDWNDNWGDDWEDDEAQQTPKVNLSKNANKQLKSVPEAPNFPESSKSISSVSPATVSTTNTPSYSENTSGASTVQPANMTIVETRSCLRSSVSFTLASILVKFESESDGADAQLLLDTILSLALVSYPPLTELFLLLNDLSGLESAYIIRKVGDEWLHTKQLFFSQVSKVVMECTAFDEQNGDEDIGGNLEKVTSALNQFFDSELLKTNQSELKDFMVQLLNLVNNVALEQIFRNSEISESQSDNYTKFLQGLQYIENEALSKVGDSVNKLVSWPKIEQTIILLTHHLKEIMKYFYESKLYACSTDELISIIKSVFISSELRDQCIEEILEIRNVA